MDAHEEKEKDNKIYKWHLSQNTTQQIKNEKQLYTKWMNAQGEGNYKKYRKKDKELKRLVTKEKNKTWKKPTQI